MDTMDGYLRGKAARLRGDPRMVFDWDRAAKRIVEAKPKEAVAGLEDDFEWTAGTIFENGKPVTGTYTYLASNHAKPMLMLDGDEEECWLVESESPGWDENTKWPESALAILRGKRAARR